MSSHFVESHSGGYYFSSDDPNIIEGYGEDSGNGDNIIFTYDDEDMEEPLKSLVSYLTKNLIFDREKLIEKLNSHHIDQIGVYAALTEIRCEAIYEIDNNKDMIKILFEENKIDQKMYEILTEILNDRLTKQLDFINNTDKIGWALTKKKEK